MATITITRTVSAGDLTRTVTALRAYFGLAANATGAQVQAAWETQAFNQLKGIVRDYEAGIAAKAASDAVTDIGLT